MSQDQLPARLTRQARASTQAGADGGKKDAVNGNANSNSFSREVRRRVRTFHDHEARRISHVAAVPRGGVHGALRAGRAAGDGEGAGAAQAAAQ